MDESFMFDLRIMSKVYQQPQLLVGGFQVVDYLGAVFISQ